MNGPGENRTRDDEADAARGNCGESEMIGCACADALMCRCAVALMVAVGIQLATLDWCMISQFHFWSETKMCDVIRGLAELVLGVVGFDYADDTRVCKCVQA